jgi:hypothetical protein
MQPTEARGVGDAPDDRAVPAVWPRPTHVGNEKYLADSWIIEACNRNQGVEGLQSEDRGAAQRCESRRPHLRPEQVSNDGSDESDRSQPDPSDRLQDKLAGYHAYHATRADLLRRLGRSQQSRAAYGKAIELAGNTAEIAYLTRRRDQLG